MIIEKLELNKYHHDICYEIRFEFERYYVEEVVVNTNTDTTVFYKNKTYIIRESAIAEARCFLRLELEVNRS